MHKLVPSRGIANARVALGLMLPGATWLRAAVAFATQSGVSLLHELLDKFG